MPKYLLGLFCAVLIWGCSQDDEPSGYVKLVVDGQPAKIANAKSMSDNGYFDYYNNWGIGYGGNSLAHSLFFMHASGMQTISSLEYFSGNSPYIWEQHELAYVPAPGYESHIDVETDAFIQGSFSGQFANQQGDTKQVSGTFKIYK